MNCKKAGKKETVIMPVSKLIVNVLKILQKHEYVKEYKIEEGKFQRIIVSLGRINNCKAVKPRFYVKKDEFEKYIQRYLPARDFGILIISTSKGLMTHKEAMEMNIGGSVIAYCF
jgi:small subunit ribosomal protein S8